MDVDEAAGSQIMKGLRDYGKEFVLYLKTLEVSEESSVMMRFAFLKR